MPTDTSALPRLTIVVAYDSKRGIGVNNQLPWRLPEDLAHFKRVTLERPVIMGRKTFDSIGRPLPKRRNIVISRNPAWKHEGVEVADSLEAALAMVANEPASLIGGAQIFAQGLAHADQMIITEIEHAFACDTFFPAFDLAEWTETARERHWSEANGFHYAFVTYVRKQD